MATGEWNVPKKLLWENPYPYSEFAAGTINNLDLSPFRFLLIEYNANANNPTRVITFIHVIGRDGMAYSIWGYKLIQRNMSSTATSITFEDGRYASTYGSASSNNSYIIPYRVWGFS